MALAATIGGLLSGALCLWGSWVPSFWGDEATSVLSAQRPLPSLFWMLGRVDAVHGAYYLLMHFWVGAFGASPFAMRLPSAIAAGLTVAGVIVLATRLVSLRTGIFAGVLCIVLPRITYMGEEARGYAMSAACAVWVTVVLVGLLRDRPITKRRWLVYSLGLALCAYIFLFSLLMVAVWGAAVLAMRDTALRNRWGKWTGIGLLLATPIIGFGFFQRSQIAFLTHRSAATFSSVFVGQWFGNPTCAIVCWVLIAASLMLAIRSWRRRRPGLNSPTRPDIALIGAVWVIVPAALLLTINFVDSIYTNRYLTFATPGIALLIGYFLGRIRPIGIAAVVALVVVGTAAPSYFSQRTSFAKNDSDWAVVAAVIEAHAKPGDGMVFDEGINPSKRPRLGMRTYPSSYRGLVDVLLQKVWWKTDYWSDQTYPVADIAQHVGKISTVWLTEYRSTGSPKADRYGMSELDAIGFSVVRTYKEHSSVIYELQRH
jgi:mannosyltransferase